MKVKNPESVAEHTFSMCAMAMVLADILRLDTRKAMKMVMLHDLAESTVGDYMPGELTARQKVATEKKAMKSALVGLPSTIRSDYEKIWLEYLHNKTGVAKFVHRIDKLEMALQANWYAKQGYADKLLAPFFKSAQAAVGDKGDIVSEILKSLRPAVTRK